MPRTNSPLFDASQWLLPKAIRIEPPMLTGDAPAELERAVEIVTRALEQVTAPVPVPASLEVPAIPAPPDPRSPAVQPLPPELPVAVLPAPVIEYVPVVPETLTEALDLLAKTKEGLPFLCSVATGIWRTRRNMLPTGNLIPLEGTACLPGTEKAYRRLLSTWQVLADNGLEIQDHTGEIFISGQQLEVADFSPVAGLTQERVVQTMEPSIYLDGTLIQMGKVFVGTPPGAK